MRITPITIRAGDGPYELSLPLVIQTPGGPVATTAAWLAGDGLGHAWSVQVRASDSDRAGLIASVAPADIEVLDLPVGELGAPVMCVRFLLRPGITKLLTGKSVAELQLKRSGDRSDTVWRLNINGLRQVNRSE